MKLVYRFEKEVAEYFGGSRHVRINRAEVHGDIDGVSGLSIECKYGKQVPSYALVGAPLEYVVNCSTRIHLIPSGCVDGHETLALATGKAGTHSYWLWWERKIKNEAHFIANGLAQAESYGEGKPILCVKKPRMKGFVIIWEAGCGNKS